MSIVIKIFNKGGDKEMNKDIKLEEIARKIRNQKAKEWRLNNKEKVKDINKRYWLRRAKEYLEKESNGE